MKQDINELTVSGYYKRTDMNTLVNLILELKHSHDNTVTASSRISKDYIEYMGEERFNEMLIDRMCHSLAQHIIAKYKNSPLLIKKELNENVFDPQIEARLNLWILDDNDMDRLIKEAQISSVKELQVFPKIER